MTNDVPVQQQHQTLDVGTIAPIRGAVYQLRGPGHAGRSMRQYAEMWTVAALMRGESVHWIDGASRMNPTRILKRFPSNQPSALNHLHRLYVGRGFTVHQLATLVERLPREVSITTSPLVVIDAPIAMHLDRQVGDYEARCLMSRIVDRLQQVAEDHNVAVLIITGSAPLSKRHNQLLTMVERSSEHRLEEHVQGRGKHLRRWLSHHPSGAVGQWPRLTVNLDRYDHTEPRQLT
jgi:hypothetical protein